MRKIFRPIANKCYICAPFLRIRYELVGVIALGIMLGKIKVFGISLGVTWILFVGIILSHFGFTINPSVRGFVSDLGLILFVFSLGLQVGPGFFSSFKKGGLRLNMLAVLIVVLGVGITVAIHFITGTPMPTMVGVMSGAVSPISPELWTRR